MLDCIACSLLLLKSMICLIPCHTNKKLLLSSGQEMKFQPHNFAMTSVVRLNYEFGERQIIELLC